MRSEQDELAGAVRSVTTGGRCCSWAVQSEAVQSSQSQRDTDLIRTASSVLVGVAAVCVWTAAQLKKVKKKKKRKKRKKGEMKFPLPSMPCVAPLNRDELCAPSVTVNESKVHGSSASISVCLFTSTACCLFDLAASTGHRGWGARPRERDRPLRAPQTRSLLILFRSYKSFAFY